MLEILLNFEHTASLLSPTVLVSGGIIAAAAGLVMWLAGTALRRFLLFIVCAAAGAVAGLYFVGKKTLSSVGLASLFGILAAILDRLVITILAAALAVVIAAAVMAWHYEGLITTELTVKNPHSQLNEIRTLEFIGGNIADLTQRAVEACRLMPTFNWLIFPVLIVIFIAGGFFFWNIICAWFWATAGTMLVYTGMVSLLLYKGSSPITSIFSNGPYFVTVFLVMMVLGTLAQLFLFHQIKTEEHMGNPSSDGTQKTQQGWRGL